MSVADFLNRSMAKTGHSVLQQQHRCLEERMKLLELNMDSALKMIDQIATAVDWNSMGLKNLLSSISEHSLQFQKVINGLSAQLNDIRNSLQKVPLIRFDEEPIGKSAQVVTSKETNSKVIEEIQQTNGSPIDDEEKNSRSSSFDKSPAREVENKPLDQQSLGDHSITPEELTEIAKQVRDLEISMLDQNVKQIPKFPSSIGRPLAAAHLDEEVLSDSEFGVPREEESATIVNNPDDLLKTFKDVKLFEWKEPDKSILPLGHGDLKFKKEDGTLSINFISDNKLFNYWVNVDLRFKIIGKNAVMFDCYGGSEDAPIKILLSILPGPSSAEDLFNFIEENFAVSNV